MMIRQHLHAGKQQLISIADNPLLEAEILFAHVLKKSRSYLHAYPEQIISKEAAECFANLIQRRSRKEPIAYLTGTSEFWSLKLSVNTDTLIPRPETEHLVESVLALFPNKDTELTVADLGTGCGAIAFTSRVEAKR